MQFKSLTKAFTYPEIYSLLKDGVSSVEGLTKRLRERGLSGGQMKRRSEFLISNPPYIIIDGDQITYDEKAVREDLIFVIRELCHEEPSGNVNEIYNLKARISELEDIVEEQDGIIRELKSKTEGFDSTLLKTEIEQKVLVASSIEVGPQENVNDDIFLDDPKKLLDAEKLVSLYGGKLDSFYEIEPTDEELELAGKKKKDEAGRELTLDNYRRRLMNRFGGGRLFQKRADDIRQAKEFEGRHGKIFPESFKEMYKPDDESTPRQRERNRYLKNRFETLNRIIECNEYTNQEKLMLFALNGEYRYTDMEKYLVMAANYCINANFIIYILQNPNICETYDQMRGFMMQFASASEFRMKLDLARELIAGKWYITGEYNNKKTRFQLVPIEEFNELRQKAGLPISRFTYQDDNGSGDGEDGSGSGDGEGSGDQPQKKANVSAYIDPDQFDYPDDGLEPEYDDDDLPFGG
ncbi:MAG: hypothetical protein K6E75_09860 [Lachnospiraceae bacterium]|nr:hypothetical protein [Lachnospiraceae bacterium]